jgi:hypothetical protein
MGGGVGGDVEVVGGSQEIFEGGGTGVVDRGEEDVVVTAFNVSGGGVEERKEYLRHLFEVLVAEATEEEGTGLGLGEFGDRGAQGPCACGIVGDVEEDAGALWKGEEFEAPGPFSVADACFYSLVGYFVTTVVTCCVVMG